MMYPSEDRAILNTGRPVSVDRRESAALLNIPSSKDELFARLKDLQKAHNTYSAEAT